MFKLDFLKNEKSRVKKFLVFNLFFPYRVTAFLVVSRDTLYELVSIRIPAALCVSPLSLGKNVRTMVTEQREYVHTRGER